MIPSARTNASRVAEAALHFVSKCDGCDHFASTSTHAFCNGKCGGNVVAGMRGLFRQVRVVEIEIADGAAVRERRPVRWRLVIRAKDCRAAFGGELCGHSPRDHTRFFLPCAERAAE